MRHSQKALWWLGMVAATIIMALLSLQRRPVLPDALSSSTLERTEGEAGDSDVRLAPHFTQEPTRTSLSSNPPGIDLQFSLIGPNGEIRKAGNGRVVAVWNREHQWGSRTLEIIAGKAWLPPPENKEPARNKLEFEYLLPEGNVIFYEKLLAGLIDVSLDQKSRALLKGIPNLTPGDFKTVRDRFSFFPGEELDHGMLLAALEDEGRIKNENNNCTKIGF